MLPTFGWTILASIAGIVSGAAVIFAFVNGPWERTDEIGAVRLVLLAATVAEVAFFGVIVSVCRHRGWRAIDYLALVGPRGNYLRWSLIGFFVPLAMSTVASSFDRLIADPD